MLQKIKKIWKTKWLILEGVFNYYFTRKKIEKIASYRNDICSSCPLIDIEGSKCEVPGTQPCCGDCGCSLKYKTRSMSSSCPQGRWFAVMTEEEEDEINSKLDIDEIIETEPDPNVNTNSLFKKQDISYAKHVKLQDDDYVNDFLLTQELLEIPNACDDACILESPIEKIKEQRYNPLHRFSDKMLGARHLIHLILNKDNGPFSFSQYGYLVQCYMEYPVTFREWCKQSNIDIDTFTIPITFYYNDGSTSIKDFTIDQIYKESKEHYDLRYKRHKADIIHSDYLIERTRRL